MDSQRRGNTSGGGGNSNSAYDRCISHFYNSFDGKVVQFAAPTSLIPRWNPGAWRNAKNWVEVIGTKTVVAKVALAGGNAGPQVVNYSLTAGTATTAASELSAVVPSALTAGSKLLPPVAVVASGMDVLRHVGCAAKSVLGFTPTLVP